MNEIFYEDLEPSEDHTILEYRGVPFNGLAVECDESNRRIAETPYVDGQRCGIARTWSASGRLLSEQGFLLDSFHGKVRTWFEDGRQKSEAAYELGICIAKQDWNALGDLVDDYRLAESDPQFKTLQRLREFYGQGQQ